VPVESGTLETQASVVIENPLPGARRPLDALDRIRRLLDDQLAPDVDRREIKPPLVDLLDIEDRVSEVHGGLLTDVDHRGPLRWARW
jgi:hypothetical protein